MAIMLTFPIQANKKVKVVNENVFSFASTVKTYFRYFVQKYAGMIVNWLINVLFSTRWSC